MSAIDKIMKLVSSYGDRCWDNCDDSRDQRWAAAEAELGAMIAAALADAERNGTERDEPRARLDAVPAQAASEGWRPIETAPKDTEVFIGAFIDEEFHFGRSVLFYEQGNEFEGETWSGWMWSIDDCSESVAESPTHWMPIPDAPDGPRDIRALPLPTGSQS